MSIFGLLTHTSCILQYRSTQLPFYFITSGRDMINRQRFIAMRRADRGNSSPFTFGDKDIPVARCLQVPTTIVRAEVSYRGSWMP